MWGDPRLCPMEIASTSAKRSETSTIYKHFRKLIAKICSFYRAVARRLSSNFTSATKKGNAPQGASTLMMMMMPTLKVTLAKNNATQQRGPTINSHTHAHTRYTLSRTHTAAVLYIL